MRLFDYLGGVRLIKPIGALAFARHTGAAFAAQFPIPSTVGMIFANPAEAELPALCIQELPGFICYQVSSSTTAARAFPPSAQIPYQTHR
jgi:hypothetical protein